ncbi:MAG: hypothetical protein A2W82_10550 [Sulfurimonas sp. RIFCSPLOWO2_12_36_12]|uniref:TIR domain-containing protein n=1 Tax=Sulfurimonas sp. RIFCSPLOWO2_12_36_12 TaxID=1802253 RepID=UPI0008B32BB8|nr:reverse transcriptase domain-containing protein [Sulfurimonas sp. RIFCSPLOWO2_12_36_12]OHE01755.1 MAG: hypothetical protein A2W82_10550 [Sulfurimonas sp. RIFCSPLOWO2_12_36_12]
MTKKLHIKLQKTFEESLELFNNLTTASDVASFLEIPLQTLIYILYKDTKLHYKEFKIKKKSGKYRIINKPIGSISILQKKLLPFLQFKYKIKKPVHGFVNKKSVLSNAEQHLKKKFILNIDLKDFFSSINFGRVRGLFISYPFNMGNDAATLIAQICCHKNGLPQGTCTSPILSNFIASRLDVELIKYANATHTTYTRYADDITFSSTKKLSSKMIIYDMDSNPVINGFILSDSLKELIKFMGFDINYDKVRLETKNIRQEVTGITVNDFPNVKRNFIKQIRAILHSWENLGLEEAEKKHLETKKLKMDISSIKNDGKYLKNVVIGKLAYLKMIRGENDIVFIKLALKLASLSSDNLPKFIKEIKLKSEEFDVFICHASEDKEKVARPLYRELTELGINAFLDEEYIEWGDSLTAKINHALGRSKYVIAILSNSSINKEWPLKEINSTLAREISGDKKLLSILVGDEQEIFKVLPLLADKLYKPWNNNAKTLAIEIKTMLIPK